MEGIGKIDPLNITNYRYFNRRKKRRWPPFTFFYFVALRLLRKMYGIIIEVHQINAFESFVILPTEL